MRRAKQQEDFRCGMVSIVGRPNVGKSTLLNSIVDEKVAIVSKVPQTTRNRIRGIYNSDKGQIVFIDTPGLVVGKDKLDRILKKASLGTLGDADCIIHLVDVTERVGKEEEVLVRRLKTAKCPIILGLNKIDHKGKYMDQYISLWEQVKNKPATEISNLTILPLSGKSGLNVDKLIEILLDTLPQGHALYPTDIVCDIPQKIVIADIIREKLLNILRDEIPHSIAVIVELIQPKKKKTTHISVIILVERESQKEIVIGKDGHVLKRVGTLARHELEDLMDTKVFLEMKVKARKKWRDNPSFLNELGLDA